MLNPKLEPGDNVVLMYMSDESLSPGLHGVVTRVVEVFGVVQYEMKWENGSTLSLLSDVDAWMKADDYERRQKKKVNESLDTLTSNLDAFKNFDMGFLVKYLMVLRESGIVNMFGASPYLWMGKDRIENNHRYDDLEDNEKYQELLEMADKAQHKMIKGVVKILESENKDVDVSSINRYLDKYSKKIWDVYVYRMSN